MAGITTAVCGSAKTELAQGAHRFGATVTPTGNLSNGSNAIAALSSAAGLVHGMSISGTGIPASSFILWSGSAWVLSQPATATNSGVTLTCSADTFNVALIKYGMAGTYGPSTTNYSNVTGNSDEASGTGYAAGGQALANNITPQNSAGNCYWSWSINPSWTSVTVNVEGCMIYNTRDNLGGGGGRAVSVHDFGGEQQVTAGTLTLLLPTNAASTSILQIN